MEVLARIMFVANVIVAGWISITCMFYPVQAKQSVFEDAVAFSDSIRLVGCLWFAICLMSIIGVFNPARMNLVFLFQFIYKGTWLLIVAVPAIRAGASYPKGMAAFFLIWLMALPFLIKWREIFN